MHCMMYDIKPSRRFQKTPLQYFMGTASLLACRSRVTSHDIPQSHAWLFIACELTLPRAEYLTIMATEYDLKTYRDREGPNNPSEPSLHDSSDHTRAESNGFFYNSFKRIL